MVVTPIPPHLVHTVFQYILPPSLPLPPHLLSKQLMDRHQFLSISPTDPTSYLCWPSADAAEVTEALERGIPDVLASEPEHNVRYTAPDEETILAHVRPVAQSPLQIVFAWDAETGTWRYHDARMLPFPQASQPSLDATLMNGTRDASGLEGPVLMNDQPSHRPRFASLASDDYWEGYESSGSSRDTSALPPSVPAEEDDRAEAAYWSSYAAVHGSGDSTMPSPRLEKRHLAQDQKPPDARGPESTFDPLVAHLHSRLQQENGYLSPRLSSPQYSSHAAKYEETPIDEEPQQTGSGKLGHGEQFKGYGFPNDDGLKVIETSASDQMRGNIMSNQSTVQNRGEDRVDGLREAIGGIYRMWKAQSGSEDADTFLNIVKETLKI